MAGGTLTIDGIDYDVASQDASGLAVDAVCMWDLDGDCWMEFHEYRSVRGRRTRAWSRSSIAMR